MNKSVAEISVIIPAHQSADTIVRALASVAHQTVRPKEVIVIDDGSKDDTGSRATSFAKNMGSIEVKVLRQTRQGPGAARNHGIKEASGRFVGFLDADDEWLPLKLEHSLHEIEKHDATFVAHDLIVTDRGNDRVVDCARHFANSKDPFITQLLRGYIATSTVVLRRDIALQSGGFDPLLPSGQDYEFWLSLADIPEVRLHVFPEALTRYHVTPNSISSQVDLRAKMSLLILQRHLPLLRRRTQRPWLLAGLRTVIIHGQGAAAHFARKNIRAMLFLTAALPVNLCAVFTSLSAAPKIRPNYLHAQPPQAESRTSRNAFLAARETVEACTVDGQVRNHLWWERMPMTYVDWQAPERQLRGPEEYSPLPERVLGESPFLTAWFKDRRFDWQQVLDLGCGSGVFSCLLAHRGGAVTAVDLTQAATTMTRACAHAHRVAVDVLRSDAETLAFRENSFDFVFSWGVLHHTEDMDAALRELSRVLKPGGTGMIMVYHRTSIVYYLHGLYWLILRGKILRGHSLRSVQDFYTDGYYHRYLTRREIVAELARAGLVSTRVTVTQYTKKILPRIPEWLDARLKTWFGMCLVAEFTKTPHGAAQATA